MAATVPQMMAKGKFCSSLCSQPRKISWYSAYICLTFAQVARMWLQSAVPLRSTPRLPLNSLEEVSHGCSQLRLTRLRLFRSILNVLVPSIKDYTSTPYHYDITYLNGRLTSPFPQPRRARISRCFRASWEFWIRTPWQRKFSWWNQC